MRIFYSFREINYLLTKFILPNFRIKQTLDISFAEKRIHM